MAGPSPVRRITQAGAALLFLAAAAGLWHWADSQRPVDPASQSELDQQMLLATEQLQERLTTDIDQRQLALEKERAESETGLGLYGLCTTWAEFYTNHPSESSRANRDRACGEYRRYVNTGELPQSDVDDADGASGSEQQETP